MANSFATVAVFAGGSTFVSIFAVLANGNPPMQRQLRPGSHFTFLSLGLFRGRSFLHSSAPGRCPQSLPWRFRCTHRVTESAREEGSRSEAAVVIDHGRPDRWCWLGCSWLCTCRCCSYLHWAKDNGCNFDWCRGIIWGHTNVVTILQSSAKLLEGLWLLF
jgi:hypothetical protein